MAVDIKIGQLETEDSITMFGIPQLPYIVAKDGMASLILRNGVRLDFNTINDAIYSARDDYGEQELYIDIKSEWNNDESIQIDGVSVTVTTGNNPLNIVTIVVHPTGSLVLDSCIIQSETPIFVLNSTGGNITINGDTKISNKNFACVGVFGGTTTVNSGIISGKCGIVVSATGELIFPSTSSARILGTDADAVEVHPCRGISINGGTFSSYNGVSIGSYENDGNRMTGFVTGGQLDREPSSNPSDPDYDILASGYLPRNPCRIVKSPYEQS